MKIYSMTATFGKLENQTLTLQPGLNVIHAPNEWGKSTWCSFLAVMLYGLDTRAKTTKTALADKERYAPWSGAAMAGRMDLNWKGRDITIERWTKGRTPMGEFKAYETETGLPVPELKAATCGELLLGVERSVFMRAGFLRLSDLPVTQDETLRRRLNALVTTGDESSDGDLLRQKLKDLKNKCRYNRSGLLPQAEAQRAELENKISELLSLQNHSEKITVRQQELEAHIAALENHKQALEYAAAEENIHRVAAAKDAAILAARRAEELEEAGKNLPAPEEIRQKISRLQLLQEQQLAAQMDAQMLPQPPQLPNAPTCFYGLNAEQAAQQVNTDVAEFHRHTAAPKRMFPWWIIGLIAVVVGVALALAQLPVPGLPFILGGAVLFVIYQRVSSAAKKSEAERNAKAEAIRSRYSGGSPEDWLAMARVYGEQQRAYEAALEVYGKQRQEVEQRLVQCGAAISRETNGASLSASIDSCRALLRQWDELADAQRERQRTQNYAENLQAVAKPVTKPAVEDRLTFTEAETARLLSDARFEQKQLQLRFGQYQGKMDALGSPQALQLELERVESRITRLTDTYNALDRALNALEDATSELQRRFAPRIAKEAQRIFAHLTGGRYERLTLSQDLSVNAGAKEEPVLRGAMWRSEGTVDQLYLALRLAVAKELTPDAPMVLDDALVRFDDTRHAAAMELLRQEAEDKQIILFTCQERELKA